MPPSHAATPGGTLLRTHSSRFLLAVTLTCAAAFAQSQPQWPSLRIVGQIGGPTIAIAADGNLVLAASGYQIIVYDASDPNALREVGAAPTFGDFIRGIALEGKRAYVAAGSSGFHVLDLSDPASPSLIGTWNSPGSAEGVAVVGNIAYLADGPFGLRLLDLTDASRPDPIGSAFDDSFAFDIAITGTTAVVAAGGRGVLLADVSNPRALIERAAVDTPGYARGVAIAGVQAFVADQWEGIAVVDVVSARMVASVPTGSWAFDIAVKQSTAFIATGSAGLVSFDLTVPATPSLTGTLEVPNGDSVSLATIGNRVFLAAGRAGLRLIDVSDRTSPRLVQSIAALGDGQAVAAAAPYVYVAAAGGFAAVDATNPTRPRHLGLFGVGHTEFAAYVATAGGYVYLGASNQLITFDVRDPGHPIETSRMTIQRNAVFRQMVMRENFLLAVTESDLLVLDITEKSKPVLRGSLPMYTGPGTEPAVGVATTGRYAFIAHTKSGMAVVDLANPDAPVVITHYGANASGGVVAIAAANGYAFVPRCGEGLEVVSVADPANPRPVASIPMANCPYRATLAGQVLYLAFEAEGVYEIDVSNPFAPRIVTQTVLPGSVQDVQSSESWLAVSVLKLGLFLLEKRSASTGGTQMLAHAERKSRFAPPRQPRVTESKSKRRRPASSDVPVRPNVRQVVINSTNDSGPGTLRDAIASAAAGDVITFDAAVFPPTAPVAIRPLTRFGCVQSNITIDASNAGVILDGSMIPADIDFASGISVCDTGAVVRGLQIINFPGSGISISGTDNTIGGDRGRGTGPIGEGNLCSGNREGGIDLGGTARGNRMIGNLVGLSPSGFALRFQQPRGVAFARASDNVLGGSSAADRNVIAGNEFDVGLAVAGHNTVIGNYIGTDATGTKVVPNQLRVSSEIGVNIESGSYDNLIAENVIASRQAVAISDIGSHYNRIVRNRIGIGPDGARIAGDPASLGSGIGVGEVYNLVSGNVIGGLRGQAIHTTAPSDVYILGNRIGTDPSGTISIPNDAIVGGSIQLRGARRIFVGGASGTEGNNVSGNIGSGIELRGPGNEQNFVIGNLILGNTEPGILVSSSQQNVVQQNTITGNSVGIQSTGSSANRIRRNSIFDNAATGIGDLTTGSTLPPVILQVGLDSLSGVACAGCLIEVFSDANEEGRWFEGETVAGSDGNFTMKANSILRGPWVTATATTLSGATSAFSAAMKTPPRPPRRRAARH